MPSTKPRTASLRAPWWRRLRLIDVLMATVPLVALAAFVFGSACLDYHRIRQYDDWWSSATSVRKFGWYRVRSALRAPAASRLRERLSSEDPERATLRLRVDRATFGELSSDVAAHWGEWIDVAIQTGDDELAAKLRFRGDGSAHWTSEKKSLSIKTGKDQLYRGFRRLNLTLKDVLPQYLTNSLARDFDLLAPETAVLPVFVNEHYYGIFRFVEDVDESFLRRSMRMPGNIYRADAAERGEYLKGLPRDVFINPSSWERVANNDRPGAPQTWGIHLMLEDLLGSTLEDHARLMSRLDRDELSRLLALMLISGDPYHMSGVHNQLWYDDPVTGKLHPIVWDLRLLDLESPPRGSNWNRFWREVLRDPRVMDGALVYLDEHLDGVLETARERVDTAWNTYRDHFEYDRLREGVIHPVGDPDSTLARLKGNAEQLRGWIADARVDYTLTQAAPNEWTLEVWSHGHVPVLLTGFEWQTSGAGRSPLTVRGEHDAAARSIAPDVLPNTLQPPERLHPQWRAAGAELSPAPARYRFVLSTPAKELSGLEPHFVNAITGEAVLPAALGPDRGGDLGGWRVAQLEALERSAEQTITLTGDVRIDEDLVIERGDWLVIEPGTKLTLAPDVSILVKGHVRAASSPEDPIVITSASPELPFGTFALQGPGTEGSYFNHVRFERGGGALLGRVEYKGAINVYASPGVTFENCVFRDNQRCDDLLNVVKSHVDLTRCRFEGANADSIDYDMSTGFILDCDVIGSGNDGLDLMTCSPAIVNTRISGSGDKGISIGEAAAPTMTAVTIENCLVGAEVKDLSTPEFNGSTISGCDTGILARRKNWRYAGAGRATLFDTEVSGNTTDFDLRDGASLTLSRYQFPPAMAKLSFDAPFGPPQAGWKRMGGARRIRTVDGDLLASFRDFRGGIGRELGWQPLGSFAHVVAITAAGSGARQASVGLDLDGETIEVPLELDPDPSKFRVTLVPLPDGWKTIQAIAISVDSEPEGARLSVREVQLVPHPGNTF